MKRRWLGVGAGLPLAIASVFVIRAECTKASTAGTSVSTRADASLESHFSGSPIKTFETNGQERLRNMMLAVADSDKSWAAPVVYVADWYGMTPNIYKWDSGRNTLSLFAENVGSRIIALAIGPKHSVWAITEEHDDHGAFETVVALQIDGTRSFIKDSSGNVIRLGLGTSGLHFYNGSWITTGFFEVDETEGPDFYVRQLDSKWQHPRYFGKVFDTVEQFKGKTSYHLFSALDGDELYLSMLERYRLLRVNLGTKQAVEFGAQPSERFGPPVDANGVAIGPDGKPLQRGARVDPRWFALWTQSQTVATTPDLVIHQFFPGSGDQFLFNIYDKKTGEPLGLQLRSKSALLLSGAVDGKVFFMRDLPLEESQKKFQFLITTVSREQSETLPVLSAAQTITSKFSSVSPWAEYRDLTNLSFQSLSTGLDQFFSPILSDPPTGRGKLVFLMRKGCPAYLFERMRRATETWGDQLDYVGLFYGETQECGEYISSTAPLQGKGKRRFGDKSTFPVFCVPPRPETQEALNRMGLDSENDFVVENVLIDVSRKNFALLPEL